MLKSSQVTILLALAVCPTLALPGQPGQNKNAGGEQLLLEEARNHPIEVEAIVFRHVAPKLRALSKKQYETAREHIVQNAASAASWYPLHLAINNIPVGYAGLEHSSSFHLSGLEIYLSARQDETLNRRSLLELLSEVKIHPRPDPTCYSPFISTAAPVYRFFGERGAIAIQDPTERNEALLSLVDDAASPFELKELWDLQRQLKLDTRDFFRLFLGRFVDKLSRLDAIPVGMSALNVQWAFHNTVRGLLHKADTLGLPKEPLVVAYRNWITRSYGAPVCKDPQLSNIEIKAREEAVRIANGTLALHSDSKDHFADEDLQRLRARRVLDKQEVWSCPRPSEVNDLFIHIGEFIRNPELASTRPADLQNQIARFAIAWRKWNPKEENTDPRGLGAKLELLMTLIRLGPPAIRKPILELGLQYLTNHPAKRNYPAIWVTYVLSLKSFVSGENPWGVSMDRDEASMVLLKQAGDPSIRLLASFDQK